MAEVKKTGDIIDQLREHAFYMHPHDSAKLMEEAANELEALLDEIKRHLLKKSMWRNNCAKLVGIMMPFAMLMKPNEIDDLKIIIQEISYD